MSQTCFGLTADHDLSSDRLVGLVVKVSASFRVQILLAPGFLGGRVIPVIKKLALQWLCQAPGIIGSVLGLVCLVSVYCDWMRWKVCLQCGST